MKDNQNEEKMLQPLSLPKTPKEKTVDILPKKPVTYQFPVDQRPEYNGTEILPVAKVKQTS